MSGLDPSALRRDLARAVAGHRRLLAAGLVAAAVALGLTAVTPPAAETAIVLAAARDLPGGVPLTTVDLVELVLPVAAVPAGALIPGDEVAGRLLSGPIRRGEPVTDVRVVGPGLLGALGGEAGLVAAPVRIADRGSTALLRSGDRIDVLGAVTDPTVHAEPMPTDAEQLAATERSPRGDGGAAGPATEPGAGVVAADVLVLAVPPAADDALAEGALVVLATTPTTASRLAAAAVTSRLSVTLRSV